MRRLTTGILAVALGIFGLVYLVGNPITYGALALNPWYGPVQEHLARALTSQTPDGVIQHVTIVKRELPQSGYISWWSPEKTDFESIHNQLDAIVNRARDISLLEPENTQYITEMEGIHADIWGIRENIREACSTLC